MNGLLSTYTFLWALFDPEKIAARVRHVLADSENAVWVSSVSFWEISLKCGLGKLKLDGVVPEELPEYARRMGFDILTLSADDAASFHRLPERGQTDVFGRMIAWQAIRNRLVFIGGAREMAVYQPFGLALFP